jgi:hypothetical protein
MLKIRGAYVPGTDGSYPWVWQPAEKPLPGVQGVALNGESGGTKKWERDAFAWRYQYLGTKYGWNMTGAHNQGDRGADALLSAIEAGKKDQIVPNSQQIFAVDHGLLLSPVTPEGNQWERMKKVNMIPSLGMTFLFDPPNAGWGPDQGNGLAFRQEMSALEQNVYAYGRERVYKMLPAKSMIRAGLKPVAESDRGVLPQCCPMWNLEKLITRQDDRMPGVWGSNEKVTREEALWMYTNWAANYTGDEKSLGTLEPGKLADLVVIDGDYLKVPEEKISDLPIMLTMVNGKIVYSVDTLKPVVEKP